MVSPCFQLIFRISQNAIRATAYFWILLQKTGNQPDNAARHAGECQHPVKQQRMIRVMKGYSLDSGLRQNDGIGQKRLNSKVCGCPENAMTVSIIQRYVTAFSTFPSYLEWQTICFCQFSYPFYKFAPFHSRQYRTKMFDGQMVCWIFNRVENEFSLCINLVFALIVPAGKPSDEMFAYSIRFT